MAGELNCIFIEGIIEGVYWGIKAGELKNRCIYICEISILIFKAYAYSVTL